MKTVFGALTTGLLTCITKQLDTITETCDDSDFHYILIKTKTMVGLEVENLEGRVVMQLHVGAPAGFMVPQNNKPRYYVNQIYAINEGVAVLEHILKYFKED